MKEKSKIIKNMFKKGKKNYLKNICTKQQYF